MKTYHWADKLLTIYGKNPYGQNIYRVVWSEDRTTIQYGKEIRKYGDGKDRWILEKWMAPETYDKASWESATELTPEGNLVSILGPFPNQGDWEHCYTFEGAEGQYCPVEVSLAELICVCIERGKMLTAQERAAAHVKEQERKKREQEALLDAVWNDSKPAVHAQMPDHIERFNSFDVQRRIKALPNVEGFSQVSEETAKKLSN